MDSKAKNEFVDRLCGVTPACSLVKHSALLYVSKDFIASTWGNIPFAGRNQHIPNPTLSRHYCVSDERKVGLFQALSMSDRWQDIDGLMWIRKDLRRTYLEHYLRENVLHPILSLLVHCDANCQECGADFAGCSKRGVYIESAEMLLHTRIQTMCTLELPVEKQRVKKPEHLRWLDKYMPMTYLNGETLTTEEMYRARCDYLHTGGLHSEAEPGTRQIIVSDEAKPMIQIADTHVVIDAKEFFLNFANAVRKCFQSIINDDENLSLACRRLFQMKRIHPRIHVSDAGTVQSIGWGRSSDHWGIDERRKFFDLGLWHVVRIRFYLRGDENQLARLASRKRFNLYYEEGYVSALGDEPSGCAYALTWYLNVTGKKYTDEEIMTLAHNDFDAWCTEVDRDGDFQLDHRSNVEVVWREWSDDEF